MPLQNDPSLVELSQRWHHPDLAELDEAAKNLTQQSCNKNKTLWLQLLRKGLGITGSGLAEKLKIKRQSVLQYEETEKSGAITLQTFQKIAEALDCEFVYGFKPKAHSTFAEMMTAKTLPYVQKPVLAPGLSKIRQGQALGGRIKMFLSRPTGRGHIWRIKSSLCRPYSWVWADGPQYYQPHGVRESHSLRRRD
jgi:transcriptional regulator with XRE-family HTH domain